MSIRPPIIHMAVDRHILIQSPTGRTVVYNDIPYSISSQRIITESYILRTTAEAHMPDYDIMRINQKRMSGNTDTISRSGLSGNCDIRSTQADRRFQTDNSGNIKHNDTSTSRFTSLTQSSGP